MITLTRAQRVALYGVFSRHSTHEREPELTYREFRKRVKPFLGDDRCIMVPWCGMWLGIETDGYTHS